MAEHSHRIQILDPELEAIVAERHIRGFSTEDLAVDKLIDAYAKMAQGIQDTVESGESIGIHTRATQYVGGQVVTSITEMYVGDMSARNSEPTYATEYKEARDATLRALLDTSIKYGDFSLLMGVITTMKDPIMAQCFLDEIHRKKERDMTVAHVSSQLFMAEIDERSYKRITLREAMKDHARRQRNFDLRRTLAADETGIAKAAIIGLALKFDTGVKEYIKSEIIDPLKQIADLPLIERQLLDQERDVSSLSWLEQFIAANSDRVLH